MKLEVGDLIEVAIRIDGPEKLVGVIVETSKKRVYIQIAGDKPNDIQRKFWVPKNHHRWGIDYRKIQ